MTRVVEKGRLGALALVVVCAAAALVPMEAQAARPSSVLGVYAGAQDPAPARAFAATLGHQPRDAMDFLNGKSWATITSSNFPYAWWRGKGYRMIWGVNMLPDTFSANSNPSAAGGSCNGLTRGATGEYDKYFQKVGRNIVHAGFAHSVIRVGWEFNLGSFPWTAIGCPSAFVEYFDAIVTTMRSVPGEHFTFEWNPTRGDLGAGNLADYYPGDRYVDDVGLDVYDIEWQHYPGARAEFRHMETQKYGLDWLASFAAAHHKRLVLPEWGLGWGTCSASGQPISAPHQQVCGGDNATWVDLMAGWMAAHHVSEATYWDFGTSSVDSGQNPSTAAMLVRDFSEPA
jgi:hypothetical protein